MFKISYKLGFIILYFALKSSSFAGVPPGEEREDHSKSLPCELKVMTLSFLDDQKDLLRTGATSKDWRAAAREVWQNKPLILSLTKQKERNYEKIVSAISQGIFPKIKLAKAEVNDPTLLAIILAQATAIKELDLSYLGLGDGAHPETFFQSFEHNYNISLAPTLARNKNLTKLNLYGNFFSYPAVHWLASELQYNTSLVEVFVGDIPARESEQYAAPDKKISRREVQNELADAVAKNIWLQYHLQ